MNTALVLGRALLALVLIVAGAAKLADRAGSRQAMLAFGVPARSAPLLAWLLPLTELTLGAGLVPATTAWWCAAGALLLLTLFLCGIAWNLARGRHPDCHCFGQIHSAPIGWKIVARNLALAALTVFVVAQSGRSAGPGLFEWLGTMTPGEIVALGVGLVACAIAGGEAWLLSNLLKQHGRLLARLDALEAARTGGASVASVQEHFEDLQIGLPVGGTAPVFALPDLDGATISLEDLRARGRPVLLLFMDPACGPCTSLLPDVARWRREHGHALTIASLSRGTAQANREKSGGHELGMVLLQAGDEIAEQYQALGTPSAVLVDASGRLGSRVAQGAAAIRRLVAGSTAPPAARPRPERHGLGAAASAGLALAAVVALSGARPPPHAPVQTGEGNGLVLQVEGATGWRTWWQSDSAPSVWAEPLPAVLGATHWSTVANGVELGELVVSGGSLALRTRIVLGRFDPRRHAMVLVGSRARTTGRPTWTIDSADRRAVLAFNAGQFGKRGAWGWLVRDGRELQAPARGPLSMAVAVTAEGEARFVSPDSIPAVWAAGMVREAFQSYPALLVGDGHVPDRLRNSGGPVNLGHRDARLSLCVLGDGRLLVALTRFDNLGRVFGSFPIGLTLDETAAVMGALGCRRAVSLDGGLSAQLIVRPDGGPASRWAGNRTVPLGIEVRPRP